MDKIKNDKTKIKSQWQFPNIYLILLSFMLVAAFMSYVVDAGQYDRMVMPNGRLSVVPGTFRIIESTPVGVMQLITALHQGLVSAASVIFLVFMVGGSVGVVRLTGVVDYGLNILIKKWGHKPSLILGLLTIVFGAISAFTGQVELGMAYVPIVMPLAFKLGYDSMTATALALLGPTLGFAFGIAVPATIGTAHMIAELPMFSGALFRSASFVLMMIASALYIIRYAENVRKNPEKAINQDVDLEIKKEYQEIEAKKGITTYTKRHKYAAIVATLLFCGIVGLILVHGLRFNQISGLFVLWAIVVCVIVGDSPNKICENFNQGFREIMVAAIIVGVARAIPVVMEAGNILDTLVYTLVNLVGSLPSSITAVGILISQTTFNFLIPSGSGQMLATLPVLIPLGDLLEINRQVIVLASHWGDGVSNIFFPTSGYFIAILSIARVSYIRWLKFYAPFFIFVVLFAVIGVIGAQTINLGPF